VLDGEDISETIAKMIDTTIADGIAASVDGDNGSFSVPALRKNLFWLIAPTDFEGDNVTAEQAQEFLSARAHDVYAKQQEVFGEHIRELERVALLTSVDRHWIDHLDAMDDLRGGIGLAAYAQRNPLNEYRLSAGDMFDAMIGEIRVDTVRMVLFSRPAQQIQRVQVAKQKSAVAAAVGGEDTKKRPVVKKAAEKVGRNDPCPCGSGKKYKKCCGANAAGEEN
jgi:preprotein translocase subunit SecA